MTPNAIVSTDDGTSHLAMFFSNEHAAIRTKCSTNSCRSVSLDKQYDIGKISSGSDDSNPPSFRQDFVMPALVVKQPVPANALRV
jgi:hypothetical protein